jgi:ATP-binding cassette, subfamily B, bacterial
MLNTWEAVAIVFLLVVAVDSLILYGYIQQAAGAYSSPMRDYTTFMLIATLVLVAINILVSIFTLLRARRSLRLIESRVGYSPATGGGKVMAGGEYSTRTIYWRVFREAWPYRLHLLGLLALSLMSTPVALLTPVPLKIAVDNVLGDEPLPSFMQPMLPGFVADSKGMAFALSVALIVIVALLAQLRGIGTSILRTYAGEKVVIDFRTRLFRHAQRLSLSYHDSRGTSDSIYRIQYDALAVQWIAVEGVIPFITSIVTLVGMIYVTALIDFQLALVALAISPLLFLVLRIYGRRLRKGWRGQKQLESSSLKVVQETLGGIRVVKAFGQEDRERERFTGKASETLRAKIRLSLQEGGLGSMVGLIIAAGQAAVLFIGVRNVQAGTLTLGDLLVVMGYLTQLYRPLESMSKKVGDLQGSLASAERTFTLLDQTPEVNEKPNAIPLSRAKGAVSFRNVSFAYDGDDTPVLQNISFEVDPGTQVGISGATGAGKTTLVSLLTRFYDPTSGRITLDGIDLRDYKLADLRNQFAIVLQEPILFSTSIAENIAYANLDATSEEIMAAARAANAHEFIKNLPEGYETQVGERGMKLSGGERQRISLARAFLKDAPILILDEPTSSVDVKTEATIMEAMTRLMQGRTTFMIAHRLSTLKRCDMKLEIEQGRLLDAIVVTTSRGESDAH